MRKGFLCPLFDHVNSEILANSPALRVVIRLGVGVDDIDVVAYAARKIPIDITIAQIQNIYQLCKCSLAAVFIFQWVGCNWDKLLHPAG